MFLIEKDCFYKGHHLTAGSLVNPDDLPKLEKGEQWPGYFRAVGNAIPYEDMSHLALVKLASSRGVHAPGHKTRADLIAELKSKDEPPEEAPPKKGKKATAKE